MISLASRTAITEVIEVWFACLVVAERSIITSKLTWLVVISEQCSPFNIIMINSL